jgi:hypothetical protein
LRDAKSPAWSSKDSESEQSKSVEVKKSEDLPVECGNSSEMEEGELEPDQDPNPHPDPVCEPNLVSETDPVAEDQNLDKNDEGKEETVEDVAKEIEVLTGQTIGKQELTEAKSVEVEDKQVCSEESSNPIETVPVNEDGNEEGNNENGTELKVKYENVDFPAREVDRADGAQVVALALLTDETPTDERAQNLNDKGKSVAVSPNRTNSADDNVRNQAEEDVERPSTRGFELFFVDKRQERLGVGSLNEPKDEKHEQLELSLSLPTILLPIGSQNLEHGSQNVGPGLSVQSYASSFRTNSDGFTASISFSHNPSCSLTQTEIDYEKSVGSQPIFGGVDQSTPATWQPPPPQQTLNDRSKNKEVPMYQRVLSIGHREINAPDFVEPVITMLDSEPLHVTAKRFNEMTSQSISYLKESVRDIILNPTKRWQLSAFQKTLQNRSDVTSEMLTKSHRAQLEILVSLKTGLQEFLHRNYEISSSDLAEIFLNLRCKNLTCRSLLPVDECDCKICSSKTGFCSACMCLVCSMFDMASNTCSWVGCDVCLHWCHADCALKESFIRNEKSTSGSAQGTTTFSTEIQFHCVACDHPSEMFGFVKEVFQNFARGWNADMFFKELEYVRKIFVGSKDYRGKKMHELAIRMLSKLAKKCDLQEVLNHVMGFLTESDSYKSNSAQILPVRELAKKQPEKPVGILGGPNQELGWLKSIYSDKSPLQEKSTNLPRTFNCDSRVDLVSKKEPVFDELDSIVRIKHAEAKMFQQRADDARREAEGLRRIAMTKSEKVEEEYSSRIKKLNLSESEEIRRRKVEELANLERAHQEYFNMRTRMEADIKDLLLKMEATKRNLAA